jgi:hypothetical protein
MERSFLTPNTQIPLNSRPPGTIADIAWTQLQPYRIAAQVWPVYQEARQDESTGGVRWVHACRTCNQALWFNTDAYKVTYDYTEDEKLTLIIAHIRRCHADIVNEKGEITSEVA